MEYDSDWTFLIKYFVDFGKRDQNESFAIRWIKISYKMRKTNNRVTIRKSRRDLILSRAGTIVALIYVDMYVTVTV